MPPHPGDNGDDDEYAKYRRDGFDLSPTSFQDYLLDLVNLSSIATSVGELSEVAHTPVANWLRTQGLQLLYSDTDGLYILLYDRGQQAGQRYGVLPDYLVRYLELLVDDAFADAVVPAYQALALLTYVVTTERHRLRSGT